MKILVTGGTGFLGRHLCQILEGAQYDVIPIGSSDYDVRDKSQVELMMSYHRPEIVYHLAAKVGGIGANRENPGKFWYENLAMGMNVMEAARLVGVSKLVLVGTTCSYPKVPPTIPFREADLYDGFPEETNAPYGIAKRCLIEGGRAYRMQYKMNVVGAIPTNLYGPHDNFDLNSSHVIPALIRKFHEAKEQGREVTLWGTGRATRDFLYVTDAARALANMLSYDAEEPVNIGSGSEVSIEKLAGVIASVVGYAGGISWDLTKPDGQPRRVLDTDRATNYLKWKPEVSLYDGLKKTYEWMLENVKEE
jgi:GDP-L-fucose synthase